MRAAKDLEQYYRYKRWTVTLCFPICLCAVPTGAAGCCTNNIKLPEQILVMIETSDAPCIFIKVVATKK